MKHLIRRFKAVEKPFLEPGDPGINGGPQHRKRRRSRSVSPYAHSAYNSPPEKSHARSRGDDEKGPRLPRYADEPVDDDDAYWALRTKYANYGFRR
ncbi:hypothetical protein LTR53_020195, partial [Teratosphaeriaceae sp. CCFEE 6253]